MLSYARRELTRNPRRTLASLAGVVLGVGLFSGVLFFIDGSGASMTKRAIAPVALDMQRVLTSPLGEGLRLQQRLSATGPLRAGERTRMRLTVRNLGAAPANEVVVTDRLAPALEYVAGTATVRGKPVPDVAGQSPFAHGPAQIGRNIGTVASGATVELSYLVRARRPVPDTGGLPLGGIISTREDLVPDRANPPALVPLDELRDRIAAIPGVAAADQIAFADLPPGSLRAGGVTVGRPVRVFGFDRAYAEHYPSIRLAAGSFSRDAAWRRTPCARGRADGSSSRCPVVRAPSSCRSADSPICRAPSRCSRAARAASSRTSSMSPTRSS
jgi:putative ABC transport system permease protein